MADSIIISNLPTHTPAGSDYLAIENSTETGKNTVNNIVAAAQAVQTNTQAIGTLSSLTTDAKDSLVAAVNEVDSNTDTNTAAISQLNSKFHYYAAMADLYNAVNDSGYLLFTGNSALYQALTKTTSSVRCYGFAIREPSGGGAVSYTVVSAPGTAIYCGRLSDAATIARLMQYSGTSIV